MENGKRSKEITATSAQLKAIQIEFVQIARKHQESLKSYRENPELFAQIFLLVLGMLVETARLIQSAKVPI